MISIAAFYRFIPFEDPHAVRDALERACAAAGVRGTVLLAPEGINGTIAGPRAGVDAVLAHIRSLPGCDGLEAKESHAAEMPFGRLKVRVKREIVAMGQPGIDPRGAVGTYVAPSDWDALIGAPDVVVIDTRNDFEVETGSFRGAIDPGTASFSDFPGWWAAHAERFEGKRIAMFCTGGIRCEKSTAYLKAQGVDDVYHLQGGILRYLEEVPAEDSSWEGGCFVFDERVAVGHGLTPTDHSLCRACRRPLAPAERARPEFEDGVQCHRCVAEYSEADRVRFRERQRQMTLAADRGARHLGAGSE